MVKSRHLNVRVTETLAKQLEREAPLQGVTMTAIIEAAIQRYFDDEAAELPEALILRHLERKDRSQAIAERDTTEIIETPQHDILCRLSLTKRIAESSRDVAHALGFRRMDLFSA